MGPRSKKFLAFLTALGCVALLLAFVFLRRPTASEEASAPPSIVLFLADDMGWGDPGYNGNPLIRTPHLDRMAREGLRFDRFYAASPVCSPTRASILTGRSPGRMGIDGASRGFLKDEELTLAEALKTRGYSTGHFGKWHLGTMSRSLPDGRRGRGARRGESYSPPWLHGFDRSFSTETAVPTWDPMDLAPLAEHRGGNQPVPTRYWTGEGEFATENLEGDDSRVIMDRVIDFVGASAARGKPFLAVVWFHTPHEPVVAGPRYRKLYDGASAEEAEYAGAITAMDEQIGRLRDELQRLAIDENTLLWFMSDNGPRRGSPGPFRGGKGNLLEGGIRVPATLVWPHGTAGPRSIDTAVHTNDIYPTLLEAAGVTVNERQPQLDGVSLMPAIAGGEIRRPQGLSFEHQQQLVHISGAHKIRSVDGGKSFALFDLDEDPTEMVDLSGREPRLLRRMSEELELWRTSCARSLEGDDYR